MSTKLRDETVDCISEIKHVIAQEVNALQELKALVNEDYANAVQLLYSCRG